MNEGWPVGSPFVMYLCLTVPSKGGVSIEFQRFVGLTVLIWILTVCVVMIQALLLWSLIGIVLNSILHIMNCKYQLQLFFLCLDI